MQKQHSLTSIIFAAGFFLLMWQLLLTSNPVFRFLVPAFFFYGFSLAWYNRWYLITQDKYNTWLWLRQLMFIVAGFGMLLAFPDAFSRSIFLVITAVLIAVFEMLLVNPAENILLNQTLLTAFGMFTGLFAAYYYSPAFEPEYLAIVCVATAVLTRSFYEPSPHSAKTKILASLVLALFCGELFWALNFLQFHFSVLGLMLFNFFYFFLMINYYYLYKTLNFKKIQLHLAVLSVCFVVILLVTPWKILQS